MVEIEEEEASPLLAKDDNSTTTNNDNMNSNSNSEGVVGVERRSVRTKVPEAEVRIYRQGKGPIDVIKAALGGWDQDQLEVREILDKYGFKTLYAYNPGSGRGVPIRFNPRNGRSVFTYKDGATIHLDGEPKDPLLQPITKILLGVTFVTFMIVMVMRDTPEWAKTFNFSGGRIPPWVLACAVIVLTRMGKRIKSFLEKCLR